MKFLTLPLDLVDFDLLCCVMISSFIARDLTAALFLLALFFLTTTNSIGVGHQSCKAGWIKDKLFGHKMIILGDSNFVFVMKEFMSKFQSIASVKRVSRFPGCQSHKHFNMEVDSSLMWQSPKELGLHAGPYTHGLREPFCPDCSTCDPELNELTHRNANVTKVFRAEYFPLLFGMDVTIQSKKHRTTQEHLVDYLKASGYGPGDFILLNVGLHEMAHTTVLNYGQNLKFLSDLLESVGSKLIFITTPHSNLIALPDAFERMYSIRTTDQFNAAALGVLSKNKNVIGIVDTAPGSLVGTEFTDYFRDGHHFLMNASFYNAIMMQALYVMCSAS